MRKPLSVLVGKRQKDQSGIFEASPAVQKLELSNNLAENAMRPIALGRKNWIHIGSKEAGPRVAAIISVVETCRRLKIPVRDYLGSVLPGLGDFPISRIAELTPAARATRN
jgi:transposase